MVRRKRIWLTGSLTVEMSLLMPLILLLLMSSILAVFYFHDKNILAGAAYETAAVAGARAREEEGADAGEMEALFRERADGKCILFPTPSASVEITDAEVTVSARVSRGRFGLTVEKKMAVTHPEKEIRDRKRLIDTGEAIINGTKDND